MNKTDELLEKIHSRLWWIALWLFLIYFSGHSNCSLFQDTPTEKSLKEIRQAISTKAVKK